MQLLLPTGEVGLPVPVSFWNAIMNRLELCQDKSQTYVSLGWGLIGICGSAMAFVAALPFSTNFLDASGQLNVVAIAVESIAGAVALATLIGGPLSLHFAHQQRLDSEYKIKWIKEDMQAFSDKHDTGEQNTVSGGSPATCAALGLQSPKPNAASQP